MYKQFNTLAETFLSRMEETFPQEQKVKLYRQQFILVHGMNSRKPVEMFIENLEPYGEQILLRDEIFFKKKEFVDKAQSISEKMGLIQYWDSLNINTKNSIWEYMQGLYILGMTSIGKNKELQNMIVLTKFKG
jgi:hypothetical protein